MIRTLWAYRGFIASNVRREFEARYRNSLLGATWSILSPMAQIAVYTIIFSQVMRAKLPQTDSAFAYSIYICVGLLTWGYFAEITSRCQSGFVDNANLIKKLRFPRLCLPVISLMSASVNFVIVFGLFLVLLTLLGHLPGWPALAALPVLLVVLTFALGLGITVGVLFVFFRDVGPALAILLQFWFWLTPIVYPIDILPEAVRSWLQWNPLVGVMGAMQSIFVLGHWPHWPGLIPAAVLGPLLCLLGLRLYRRHAGEMADQL